MLEPAWNIQPIFAALAGKYTFISAICIAAAGHSGSIDDVLILGPKHPYDSDTIRLRRQCLMIAICVSPPKGRATARCGAAVSARQSL
jgi:hypothetical protein